MSKIIDSTASDYSKRAARSDLRDSNRKRQKNYKYPDGIADAKTMYKEQLNSRLITRDRLKSLKARYANGHGHLPAATYSNEHRAITGQLSQVGLYLKWVRDYLRNNGVVKLNVIFERAA